jgi:NAD(P)-dependent dehydrogenase (short-subunit alcohol dehydrogenase family)
VPSGIERERVIAYGRQQRKGGNRAMDLGIAGRTALVAGGSKGMGRACAIRLASEGCRVAVVARGWDDIKVTVQEIQDAGGQAVGVSADLATKDGVARAVAAVTEKLDAPDIVVGQTGDMTFGNFADVADADYERVFRVLTMSQVYLARATLPAMRDRGWGRYIHIGAPNGKEPQMSHPHIVHNVIRPSTVAFLRVLANEVAADGVTVNVVAPGIIKTPTFRRYVEDHMQITMDEAAAWLAGSDVPHIKNGQGPAAIPARRAGRASEVGAVIAFLASTHAGYVTGEWLTVDGGRHHFAF